MLTYQDWGPGTGAKCSLFRVHHGAVLAFDYESLNEPIEQTARKLKERLAAVGLGPGHGKQLHLVAHGIGGLVGAGSSNEKKAGRWSRDSS